MSEQYLFPSKGERLIRIIQYVSIPVVLSCVVLLLIVIHDDLAPMLNATEIREVTLEQLQDGHADPGYVYITDGCLTEYYIDRIHRIAKMETEKILPIVECVESEVTVKVPLVLFIDDWEAFDSQSDSIIPETIFMGELVKGFYGDYAQKMMMKEAYHFDPDNVYSLIAGRTPEDAATEWKRAIYIIPSLALIGEMILLIILYIAIKERQKRRCKMYEITTGKPFPN